MPERPLVDPDEQIHILPNGKMNKPSVRGSTTPNWNIHGLPNKGPDPKSINVLSAHLGLQWA